MQVTTGRGGIRNNILLKVSAIAGILVLAASAAILHFYRQYETSDLVLSAFKNASATASAAAMSVDPATFVSAYQNPSGNTFLSFTPPSGPPAKSPGVHPFDLDSSSHAAGSAPASRVSADGRRAVVFSTPSNSGTVNVQVDITDSVSAIDERATKMAAAVLAAEAALFGILMFVARIGDKKLVESEKEQMAMESELFFLANYDSLTHLPNRTLFWDRADAAISRAARLGKAVAFISMDVAGFSSINDEVGRSAGDRILVECGQRIQSACRNSDLVSRSGPDEFSVIMEDLDPDKTMDGISRLMAQLEKSFSMPFQEGKGIRVSIHSGAAAYPFHGSGSEDVFSKAHWCMTKARDSGNGGSCHVTFEEGRQAPP